MGILFMSEKGGVGKSTLCYLFYLALKEMGKTVFVKDLTSEKLLERVLDNQEQSESSAEFVLVDTDPITSVERKDVLLKLLSGAERIVVPSKTGSLDLMALGATSYLVASSKSPEARAYCIFNATQPETFTDELRQIYTLELSLLSVDFAESDDLKNLMSAEWQNGELINLAGTEWRSLPLSIRERALRFVSEVSETDFSEE